jgi:hypothetical protein
VAGARHREKILGRVRAFHDTYIFGDDGHITGRVEVIAPDDSEAKRLAKQLVDGHAVEVWQEGRMVERFEPEE